MAQTIHRPKITVITPLYNRAEYIEETIESILAQDFKDFEYLIIDDGSTDNSKAVVEPLLKDPRVKYIYQKNVGEAETVNRGWGLAKGEYFTQINSDDTALPSLFKEMVSILDNRNDVVVAYSDFYFIDSKGARIKENRGLDWDLVDDLSTYSCYAAGPGSFIRRAPFSSWKKIRDPRFKYIGDTYMYWKMALHGNFIRIPKFLATWRQHDQGISSNRYLSIPENEIWYKEFFSSKDLPKKIRKIKYDTRQAMLKYYISLLSQTDKEQHKAKIMEFQKQLDELYEFRNLQVGDNDLIGNKFNGHDLHLALRERGIDSTQLVWNKESTDLNTFVLAADKHDRQKIRNYCNEIRRHYNLDAIFGTNAYDVLYNELFLNTDVVHYHLLHNISFDIQLLPILSKLKPTVWTLHDPWAFSGHCVHHFSCKRWQTGCGDCPLLSVHIPMEQDNTALNYEIKKNAIQNSQLDIIVASKWMERLVKNSPVFKNAKIHRIPFGVDQDIFKPGDKEYIREKMGIPKDALVFAARCDYSEFKGFGFVEYTLDNLKTDKEVYLLLMGGAMIKREKKYKFIEYGWVKDDELMADIYNASDLFLMPSKVDAFGMMAIEAMSCSVLPIVLEGSAIPDVVNAPQSGVAVKRDKEAYRETVQYFVDNSMERVTRAKKCLEYARENYSKENYINKVIAVYKKAMARHKKDKSTDYLLNQLKKHIQVQAVLGVQSSPGEDKPKSKVKIFAQKVINEIPFYKKLKQLVQESQKYNDQMQKIEKHLEKMVTNHSITMNDLENKIDELKKGYKTTNNNENTRKTV